MGNTDGEIKNEAKLNQKQICTQSLQDYKFAVKYNIFCGIILAGDTLFVIMVG